MPRNRFDSDFSPTRVGAPEPLGADPARPRPGRGARNVAADSDWSIGPNPKMSKGEKAIYPYRKAFTPSYGYLGLPGGGGFSLQSFDPEGWGNDIWEKKNGRYTGYVDAASYPGRYRSPMFDIRWDEGGFGPRDPFKKLQNS